jgi:hypothetical protein
MRYTALRRLGTCFLGFILASGQGHAGTDYPQKSVAELIDDLTQIGSESIAINTSSQHGFIADETPAALRTNRFGVVLPDAPPQMRELVRRGPLALPELIRHMDDRRLTKLDVGGPPPGSQGVFTVKAFGHAYSPRVRESQPPMQNAQLPEPPWTNKTFKTTYTLRVGDVCYALIGQIVNRQLQVVQPVPTGILLVNSPIEAPVLIEKVKNDWGNGEPETLKASLLADIDVADSLLEIDVADPAQFKEGIYVKWVVNPALQRLRAYFPDTYKSVAGNGLKRKVEFEKQEAAQRSP